jgi:hypothetical protein
MKMLCYIVFAALASQFRLLSAKETIEQTYKSFSGEFVIRKVIKDTEKAKELYPATSPFRGKMCVVKVEFIGDAPKWFGLQPRWVQSLECSGRIEVGKHFRGSVCYQPKFGFHFGCFSPVQFYLHPAPQ